MVASNGPASADEVGIPRQSQIGDPVIYLHRRHLKGRAEIVDRIQKYRLLLGPAWPAEHAANRPREHLLLV